VRSKVDPNSPVNLAPPPKAARWPVRRMLSLGLIVSGSIWLIIGLVVRFFIS
jgi:hypothetical protein